MSFLNLENKNILVTGVANKKSVAWYIAKTLEEEGANVIYSLRSEDRKKSLEKLPILNFVSRLNQIVYYQEQINSILQVNA